MAVKARKSSEMEMKLPAALSPHLQTLEERKQQTDLIIEEATHWATRLMQVVDKCGLSKQMAGKRYLEVEGWLLIAEFAHTRPVVEWVKPWHDEAGQLRGYEARCQLLNDDGQVVGAGESSCGLDAFPTRGKQGTEKDKAARSAAQTWAISRALRNKFSYVAKIAKFEAVPAEEMTHNGEPEESVVVKDSRETLNTVRPKDEKRYTRNELGKAILDYCNNNSNSATEILKKLTGKTTLAGMTPQEATDAYNKFDAEYLSKQPPADDIPVEWPDTPKGDA